MRAAAAFMVVFVHLQVFARLLGLGPNAFTFGNAGVDVFFVISGFIMVVTTTRRRPTAQAFLLNRILRIAPFYWLVTLVVFAIALSAPRLLQHTSADAADLARSLAFVPFRRRDGMVEPVVFVGWTLNYEMAFYALFALGLALRRRVAGLALTLGVLVAAVAFGAWARPKDTLGAFYSAPMLLEFAVGMIIGAFAGRLAGLRIPPSLALALGGVMLALILAAPRAWPGVDRALAFGAPGAVLVLSAVYLEEIGWVARLPWLQRLGDASFATYLTHFFVTQTMVKGATALGITFRPAVAAATIATFLVVALVGLGAHTLIERPMTVGLKQRLRERSARPSLAAEGEPQET